MTLWIQNREMPKVAAVSKHVQLPVVFGFDVEKVGRGSLHKHELHQGFEYVVEDFM